MVEITWLGHACFRIRGRDATVITDPCDKATGYDMGRPPAEIITISGYHPNHSNIAGVRGTPKVVDGPGEYEINEVMITGISTYSEPDTNKKRERNTIYMIEIDGVSICHLGDLSQPLTSTQVESLGNIDVLLVPVGGNCTIDGEKASEVISEIEPRIVIPMHYKTAASHESVKIEGPERFFKEMGIHTWEAKEKLSLKGGEESEGTQVVVLDYKGRQGRGGADV